MNNHWLKNKGLKCVVLGAGRGNRILPHSENIPKVMLELCNKPILAYVIDYWKRFTDDFIFIVGYKKEQVIKYVRKLSVNSSFVEQKELIGIADAINHVEKLVSENFIVILGDCICNGSFDFSNEMEQGVGVWKTNNIDDIKRSYSIEIKENNLTKVVEKPKEIPNNYCGMGFYFFKNKVFDYIKQTPPSKLRNEIEITDVIQNMIENGEKINPIFFKGSYINITYPSDLKKAEKIVLN
ncbi:MAG: hypothetical protein AYK22_05410 [Thermoplasmatales archaeon SG8-52-3]|nr:MAG: hypothetical protein AYK22_05410 [Thermoplasmatales archaeon SG8-52-3]